MRLLYGYGLAVVAASSGFGRQAAAQQAIIMGRATDERTGLPIAGATVTLPATNVSTRTNQSGRYQLSSAAGAVNLRVVFIGYAAQTRALTLTPGQTLTLDFPLTPAALELQAIVVTATGAQRKLELGNTIAQIVTPNIVATAPVRTLTDLLSSRAAGVQVYQTSGTTGGGPRVRIRGANSVSLSNEPLIFRRHPWRPPSR